MNCEACGMELPQGAMFCGECGRAVGTRSVPLRHPDSGMPVETSPRGSARTGSQDTVIIDPVDLQLLEWSDAETSDEAESGPESSGDLKSAADAPVDAEVEQDLAPEIEEEERELLEILPVDSAPLVDVEGLPWGNRGSTIFTDSDELERTILVPRREQGERFILQFSTGESVTVFGTGLLGRNPTPQPGEYFDQLVTISDPGKSVSKTHLEFGQEAGSFWVGDRFSGNGSIVREPESAPRWLTAGKRYRVVRGTRVDIGEQFFIIS